MKWTAQQCDSSAAQNPSNGGIVFPTMHSSKAVFSAIGPVRSARAARSAVYSSPRAAGSWSRCSCARGNNDAAPAAEREEVPARHRDDAVPAIFRHDAALDANEPTQALVVRVRQGDARAKEALVARFLAPLRRWAHGRLPHGARSGGDTEDLVQITLMRAMSRLDQFWNEGKGSFLGYIRQILLNELRDEVRRGKRGPEKIEIDEELVDKQTPSPMEMAVGHEYVASYARTLATLTRRQQSVILMRIEQCMSYAEIAEAIGESPDGVRMMVTRAMVKLAAGMNG
jgi:RNA polymerase sigma factor (sigma-70 family)